MSYLKDFQKHIENHDFLNLKTLWEEYCSCDEADPEELKSILIAIKESPLAELFGEIVEWGLPLWQTIENDSDSLSTIKLIYDLETTNSPRLAQLALKILNEKYPNHEFFSEKIRLIGLRKKINFQGAITNYELLTHMDKGKFVYHTGGWGAGEIVELSLVREQLVIEFENVLGRKDMSFENAFRYLIPLASDHFLSKRFGNPDKLEETARKEPAKVIHLLLRDLGPKTAAEIKDELCELVIPQNDWTKWWQNARSKLKKDTLIEPPKSIKDTFKLRNEELSHEERLIKLLKNAKNLNKVCQAVYSFTRDFPETLSNQQIVQKVNETLLSHLEKATDNAEKIQALLLHIDLFHEEAQLNQLSNLILNLEDYSTTINDIEIAALKKKALIFIREKHDDWLNIFLELFFQIHAPQLKEYIFKELEQNLSKDVLQEKIENILKNPIDNPKSYLWYFQKLLKAQDIPYGNIKGKRLFLENLLVLLNYTEQTNELKDIAKKIYSILSAQRYIVIREIIEGADIAYLKEFLLLVTKCQSLSNHDKKIMHSLAEVANPNLTLPKSETKDSSEEQEDIIWTTKEGFIKTQERIERISTVETVENAQEIEAARALGDLRENSEYKFALEKRARLQAELGMLSQQLNKARIITQEDISTSEVGVGTIVTLKNSQEEELVYTILGPWDADVDKNILSFKSKLALAMTGKKIGDKVDFRDETYEITEIKGCIA